MSEPRYLRNVRSVTGVHPAVYGLLAGCVALILVAAWLAFAHDGYAALQVVVAAAFAVAFVATPLVLYRLSGQSIRAGAFRDWLDSELEVLDGTLSARSALVMIVSAPAACALGITAVSAVAWLTAAGVL